MKLFVHISWCAPLLVCFGALFFAPVYANAEVLYNILKQTSQPKSVLIVYTKPYTDEESPRLQTRIHMIEEIIKSHWNITNTKSIYIGQYQSGTVSEFDTVFVIEEFGKDIPANFIRDIFSLKENNVVWIGTVPESVLAGLGGRLSPEPFHPLIDSAIEYKDVSFSTHSLDIVERPVNFPKQRSKILATLTSTGGKTDPFIQLVDGRLLFVASVLPYWYDTDSYTTVLLDTLHHILGHHKPRCRALLRLEDVNAFTYRLPERDLYDVYDLLKSEGVPFHIALIVRYINKAKETDLLMHKNRRFTRMIKQMVGEGWATIVQHGYTHQIGDEISGVGFEFWDYHKNAPLEHDSLEYVRDKVVGAQDAMRSAGLPVTDIWETPHYALSDLDNGVLNLFYPLRYEHIPNIGSLPFLASIDNIIYIPENLGYVFSAKKDINRIKHRFEQLSVFEDPVVSFFWHPWRDPSELEILINHVHNNDCEFVSAYDLLGGSADNAYVLQRLVHFRNNYTFIGVYGVIDYLMLFVAFVFALGAFLYLRNRYRIYIYYDTRRNFDMPLSDVKDALGRRGEELPKIGFLIPARNEGYVIENTIRRLDKMDYPKSRYEIFVIVDERELDDDVELLTKDVALATMEELHNKHGTTYIRCIEIPKWYSGEYGNTDKTYAKSTKGRALNYALQILHSEKADIDIIGVLDADGRPDKNILKEVAYKYVVEGGIVLQGPVFQVSNFGDVSFVGKAAGMELALHHMTELPAQLYKEKKMQFLAGTNYFIDADTMYDIGGWNQHALVEDAELALRLYARSRIVASWLGLPEIEQTPPSFSVYKKQRERWVRGHFDLIKPTIQAKLPIRDTINILSKLIFSQFRFIFDVGVPVIAVALLLVGVFGDLPEATIYITATFLLFSVLIWDVYGLVYRRVVPYTATGKTKIERFWYSLRFFLFTPMFIIIQAIPRVQAMWNYFVRPHKNTWYKTLRTKERVTE